MRIHYFMAAALLAMPQVAQAQLAGAQPPRVGNVVANTPASARKVQDADVGAQPVGMPIDVANTIQMVNMMAGPESMKPVFVRCDPRTLPNNDRDRDMLSYPSPDTLALGEKGQITTIGTLYFSASSDMRQCPQIGKTQDLPPHLLDVVR